jgi:hypothetical protein
MLTLPPGGAGRGHRHPRQPARARGGAGGDRADPASRSICGRELVGYGPHPNEICALLEQRRIPTIYGNYDYAIARDLEDCGRAYRDQNDRELGQRSVEWTLAHTNRRSKSYVCGLPFASASGWFKNRVRLVHGSPREENEYLFADKPARTFERIAAGADCDVLVFGHTHQPWLR